MENERWKTIEDCKNYEISSMGRVRNKNTGKLLSPYFQQKKYMVVRLAHNGTLNSKCVHRLVAEAFFPDKRWARIVHKNGDPRDCRLENLQLEDFQRQKKLRAPKIDITGKKFAWLTVLEYDHMPNGRRGWRCRCDCGKITYAPTFDLMHGLRISCGCYRHSEEFKAERAMLGQNKKRVGETLCFSCEHATNKKNLCPWVGLDKHGNIKWQEVEGWVAETVKISKIGETKRVISCPLYKEG